MTKPPPMELDIPDGIGSADRSVEILRAWIADGSLMLSLSADAFGDRTEDWGRLLAEIGHHIAKATELDGQKAYLEALQALQSGFDRNISQNQPTMEGKVRGRTKH